MVLLPWCCNDEGKARILDQARKVADEGQQVDVSLALWKRQLYRARLASQYKGRKGIL